MNKPNKPELEYFIRYSLDSDKYKRYMELYDEIERLNNIINKIKSILHNSIEYNALTKLTLIEESLQGVDKE